MKSKLMRRINTFGWFFILPAVMLIIVLGFYPMLNAFLLSLRIGNGDALRFAGPANYLRLIRDPTFLAALKNIFFYLILEVPIMLIMALVIASILNDSKLKLKGVYRVAIFLPCATSPVSYSAVFRQVFSGNGLLNQMFTKIGIFSAPFNFLSDPLWAKLIIVIALLWRWTGYNMIFYLAGLQNIDSAIYEAATIDGANIVQKFFRITIPLIKPIILLTAILSTNGTLQIFDEVMNLTRAGPGNATLAVSNYIYNLTFKYVPQFGYASAISYTVFFMVAILALLQMRIGERK
jgi:lactose/L-arabinose transport system permease protein